MKGRALRAVLVERDGPHCHWCGRLTVDPLVVGDTADAAATVDHIDVPKLRRSVRDPARAVVACSRCNHDRGCLTVEEWRAVLEVRATRVASFGDENQASVGVRTIQTLYPQVGATRPSLAASKFFQRLKELDAFLHGLVIVAQLHADVVSHLSLALVDVEEIPQHGSNDPPHTGLLRTQLHVAGRDGFTLSEIGQKRPRRDRSEEPPPRPPGMAV